MNLQNTIINSLARIKNELVDLTWDELNIKINQLKFLPDNDILLELSSPFPTKILEPTLINNIKYAINTILPDTTLTINLASSIHNAPTQIPGKGLRGIKNVIAVASGKGGVGKSTIAVNLAAALTKAGAKTGILDADIYGPSIPLMLGKEAKITLQDEKYMPILAHGIYSMSIGYIIDTTQALIWRGPMLAKSLLQMINFTLWEDLDYLFIDLPPGTGDIVLSLVQKIPLAGALIVTTPQNVATLDAQKAITMFHKTNIRILGVIENMAYFHCAHCNHQDFIFSSGGGEKLAKEKQIPFLGHLPLNTDIRRHGDAGNPIALEDSMIATEIQKIALRTVINLTNLC